MKKLIFCLLFLSFIYLEGSSSLLFDAHFSPKASSSGLLFSQDRFINFIRSSKAYEVYEMNFTPFETSSFHPKLTKETTRPPLLALPLRVIELYGFWTTLSHVIAQVQYEVFGYGYRLRTFKNLPQPKKHYKFYVSKKAYIQSLFNNPRLLTRQERLLLSQSGFEACSILAHELSLKALSTSLVEPRQSPLYLKSKFTLPLEILRASKVRDLYQQSNLTTRQDFAHYFTQLFAYYPSQDSSKTHLKSLRKRALFSCLFDPMIYLTLASECYYCLSSKTLALPKALLLPVYQLLLSPFGPEDAFGFYVTSKRFFPTYFYFKKSHFAPLKTWAFGFENRSLIRFHSQSLGLCVDVWKQPLFQSKEASNFPSEPLVDLQNDFNLRVSSQLDTQNNHFGFALSCIYQWHFLKAHVQTFYIQLGYKKEGYLPGESTEKTPLFRLGLSLFF